MSAPAVKRHCGGKVRYRSQTAAVSAMRRIGNAGLSSYPCPSCRGWHLGNSRSQHKVQARIDQLLAEGKSA